MFEFEFQNPVRVVFGAGKLAQVGKEAARIGQKALIVSYRQPTSLTPVIEQVEAFCQQEKVQTQRFLEIEPNPDIESVRRGVAIAKAMDCDLVIGVGGGSAMDAAKAIAAGVYYPHGDLWNMVYARHDVVTAQPPVKALPTLMVPTLPATGSEMNMCSVLSNKALREKSYIWSECIFPRTAVIDPQLTTTLPAFQTACAAADTISHVLEIYINGPEKTPLQHYFQESVMRVVLENAPKALANPGDLEARANLQWASVCAINGWASPGYAWTPIHQAGHVLTSRHRVNHGSSLSVLMPAWMTCFHSRRPRQYLNFARRVMDIQGGSDQEATLAGINAFTAFLKQIGVPVNLSQVNIGRADLPPIVEDVIKVSFGKDGFLSSTPPVSRADLENMLETALN